MKSELSKVKKIVEVLLVKKWRN